MIARATLRALLAPLQRRIFLALSRGVVRLVTDSTAVQELQVALLRGELRSGVERLQEYGFSSRPLPGAWAFVACVGGNRDHPVVIATDDGRYRPRDLEPGEVGLYDHTGQFVRIKADGTVVVHSIGTVEVEAAALVRLDAPNVTCTGDLFVAGVIQATGDIQSGAQVADVLGPMSSMRAVYNAHHHNETDNAPAPTQVPNTAMA